MRTRHRALRRMVELTKEDLSDAQSVRVAIPHADALEEALRLREALEAELNCIETHVVEVASSLTVHGGPGLVGVIAHVQE